MGGLQLAGRSVRVYTDWSVLCLCPAHGVRMPHRGYPKGAMALLLGDLPWVEQVELDSPHDVGDAGLAGFSGGEVADFPGFPRAGPFGPVADGEAGDEDLEQERGEGVFLLVRGGKPRRYPSRRPGRAGS
jgi:hypothetical protein